MTVTYFYYYPEGKILHERGIELTQWLKIKDWDTYTNQEGISNHIMAKWKVVELTTSHDAACYKVIQNICYSLNCLVKDSEQSIRYARKALIHAERQGVMPTRRLIFIYPWLSKTGRLNTRYSVLKKPTRFLYSLG